MHRVAITGVGVVSAVGSTVDSFWQALLEGRSGVRTVAGFDLSGLATHIGAQVADFSLPESVTLKVARRLSRVSLMALAAAHQALTQAQIGVSGSSSEPVGVYIGCSQGGFVESEPYFEKYFATGRTSPLSILKPMNSAPASQISIEYGFQGPVMTIDTACSSANHAIGLAALMIRHGMLSKAVVGGVDTVFSPAIFKSWCTLGAMSQQNSEPAAACKPFSANRDGLVLGEGAGMLVLESESSARSRGVPILALVRGYGSSGSAHHITQSSVLGSVQAIQAALVDAALSPPEVDHIQAHATGTLQNDAAESAAIKQIFRQHAYRVPISGIKPVVGHTLAASAALQAIAAVMAIRCGWIPPTINRQVPDPECDLDYTVDGPRRWLIDTCLSNSFGFGGSNAVLLLSRYRESGEG